MLKHRRKIKELNPTRQITHWPHSFFIHDWNSSIYDRSPTPVCKPSSSMPMSYKLTDNLLEANDCENMKYENII